MLDSKAKVVKKMRIELAEIRDLCRVIGEELSEVGRWGKYSSTYIFEKAHKIKMRAGDIERLNALIPRVGEKR